MAHHPLYSDLCQIAGSKYVADSDFAVWAYSKDSSAYPARVPGIVVRPNTAEEVSEIVKLANQHKVPIVPRGGGTQFGGWPPGEPGKSICVDMTRMRRILDVNELNKTVTVEAGVTCAELEARLLPKGLYAHTVFSPADSVTIGGMVCGVFGGGGQMFAGLASNWPTIVGVKAVLPNGEVIETSTRTNPHAKMFFRSAVGPDLAGLFIGSMGIFGIITEVTLDLFYWQPHREVGAVAYKYERLDDAYQAIVKLGMHEPKLFSLCILFGLGPLAQTDWQLLYRAQGHSREELDRKLETTARIIEDTAPPDAWQPADAVGFATEFLLHGHDFPPHTLGMWTIMEFLCPRDNTLEIFKALSELIVEELRGWEDRVLSGGCSMFMCGEQHYLSFGLYHKESDPEAREKALSVSQKGNILGLEMGGFKLVLNKEGGDICAAMMPPAYSNWLRALKKAMDPNNIMNPHMLLLP